MSRNKYTNIAFLTIITINNKFPWLGLIFYILIPDVTLRRFRFSLTNNPIKDSQSTIIPKSVIFLFFLLAYYNNSNVGLMIIIKLTDFGIVQA